MRVNWYVVLPLIPAAGAAISAGTVIARGNLDTETAVCVGCLIGLTFVGIVQAAYRAMLQEQDRMIERLFRLIDELDRGTAAPPNTNSD